MKINNKKTFLKKIPSSSGVYQMLDKHHKIIYVGKAKNLKNRLANYFRVDTNDIKTQALMHHTTDIRITITTSENEALLLENTLIKTLKPKYNITFKDDKSYPYIFISKHQFPRLTIYRGPQTKPGAYFGPYPNAAAVHNTLNILHKVFKLRQCSDAFFNSRTRPCVQYQIKRCSAPCVGCIEQKTYQNNVGSVKNFLSGKNKTIIQNIKKKMKIASANLDYELAACLRDQIINLQKIYQQQHIVDKNGHVDALRYWLEIDEQNGSLTFWQDFKIECFDISHTMGEATVASCVVFNKNEPVKQEYRRFNIKNINKSDDYAAIGQVLERRYQNHDLPDMIIIDGGKGQLNRAKKIIKNTDIILLAIAKGKSRKAGQEIIYSSTSNEPIRFPPESPILHMLQRIRDEAHRFAITGHRQQQAKAKIASVLEKIEGVGKKRRAALLKHFGGIQEIKSAGIEELAAVSGINFSLAQRIHAALH
jgi:excinuclease UvrABC nuclease subunit